MHWHVHVIIKLLSQASLASTAGFRDQTDEMAVSLLIVHIACRLGRRNLRPGDALQTHVAESSRACACRLGWRVLDKMILQECRRHVANKDAHVQFLTTIPWTHEEAFTHET